MKHAIVCILAAVMVCAGCNNSAGTYSPGTPARMLALAGGGADELGSVELMLADALTEDSMPGGIIPADSVFGLKFSYIHYDTDFSGSGWPDLETYKSKAGYIGGSFGFGALDYGFAELDALRIGGVYSTAIAPGTLIVTELAELSLESTGYDQATLYTKLGVKHYLNNELRLSLDWRYAYDGVKDDDNESRSFYRLSAEYLVNSKSPLLPQIAYERTEYNGSDESLDEYEFGASIYVESQLRLTFTLELFRSDSVGDADIFKFGLAFQAPNGMASIEFMRIDPDGGGTDSGVTLGWKMPF